MLLLCCCLQASHHRACAGAEERFELAEPVLSLQATLAASLGQPKMQAVALRQLSLRARKAGRVAAGLSHVQRIQGLAATCT